MKLNIVLLLVSLVLFSSLSYSRGGNLRKNFYKNKCNKDVETIIKAETRKHVDKNHDLPAKLIRLHFHDCFVRGCDASVLLKSPNNKAERNAIPNLSLSGFDEIEAIKAKVEEKCPGVVSCADILALATRDAVSYKHNKLEWEVLTGRRDGNVSIDVEALQNLPAPFFNFKQLRDSFESKGLNLHDLVVLSGAHTLGVSHCGVISNRLYNFTGKGDQDPRLDKTYAASLKAKCPKGDTNTEVEMDPKSRFKFDSSYYSIVKDHKGMFTSDDELLKNKQSSNTVDQLVKEDKFFTEFGQSMKRMGAIKVLTEPDGEIRSICSAVN